MLITTLSAHIIHINLNMIFYTHLYLYMQSDCELQACDWFGAVRLRTPSLWQEAVHPEAHAVLLLWHGLVVNSL